MAATQRSLRGWPRLEAFRSVLYAWWAPALLTLGSAVLLLGPALHGGLVQAYDLGWSPDPRWTPAVLGLDTPTPRVIPSDATVVLLGKVLGASGSQKVVLLGLLWAASIGAVRLVRAWSPNVHLGAGSTAFVVLLAQWNPFVAQRLIIGQWTVLLGYALVPWAWCALLRWRRTGRLHGTAAVLVFAGLGGGNSWVLVLTALVVAAPVALGRGWLRDARSRRQVAALIGVAVGVSACWAVPALTGTVSTAPGLSGTDEFAARSDSRFGLVGSLLSGGGIWNQFAQGPERSDVVTSTMALLMALVAAAVLTIAVCRRSRASRIVLGGALPGLLLAGFSGWLAVRPAWSWVLATLPGGGLLRDSQKLVAPWVMAMIASLGYAVASLVRRRPVWSTSAAAAALLPVPLAASMIWGFHGRLQAETVPADIRVAARQLSSAPSGEVGLLPWSQYRRYPWNGARTSLSIVPRIVNQPVLHSDTLPLSSGTVPGENSRSAAVDRRLAAGQSPVAALRAEGARYVWWELIPGAPRPAVPAGARVLVDTEDTLVLEFTSAPRAPALDQEWVRIAGAALSALTVLIVAVAPAITWRRRRRSRRTRRANGAG